MTPELLRGWDTPTVELAGRRLAAQAGEARTAQDEVRRLVAGLTPRQFQGLAADAARQAGDDLAGVFRRSADALDLCARTLTAAAEALTAAQVLLDQAERLAADHGLAVRPDGGVRPPPAAVTGPLDAQQAEALDRRLRDGALAATAAQAMAQEALAAAAEADRDAAAALTAADHLDEAPTFVLLALLDPGLRAAVQAGLLVTAVTARAVPHRGAGAAVHAAWWSSLLSSAQQEWLRDHPEELAGRDGLPAAVRDTVNRALLDRRLADLEVELSICVAATLEVLGRLDRRERERRMLLAVERELQAEPGAMLLHLDTQVPGRAVVGIGDLDRAEHVALLVPGLSGRVTSYLGRLTGGAERLQQTATRLSPPGRSVATVAWIGYETPGLLSVTTATRGHTGAEALREDLQAMQLHDVVARRDRHLTLVGHSYGSLVSGLAVREPVGVDELVLLGSPGVGADRAGELHVPRDHVFVGEAAWDAVADLGRFGTDPGDRGFGARVLQSDGGHDPVLGPLDGSAWHSDYLTAGTESLRNIALVTVGRDGAASYD